MTSPIVELKGVSQTYTRRGRPPVHALVDISMTIAAGTTVGIVGESGSGKTTLTRLLLGLEKPSSGTVLFNGRDLAALPREGRREFSHAVSAVFQNPFSSLSPRMRVWEIITEQQAIDGTRGAELRRQAAQELLNVVGLPSDAADKFPHQLSGGQRQRVAIARGVSQRPDLVVLDEPLSALDVSVSAQIVNLLLELQSTLKISYAFVAHDMHLVRHLCHEVVVIYKGSIVERGPSREVLSAPQHPYTRQLVDASELRSLAVLDAPAPVDSGKSSPRAPLSSPAATRTQTGQDAP